MDNKNAKKNQPFVGCIPPTWNAMFSFSFEITIVNKESFKKIPASRLPPIYRVGQKTGLV